MRYALCALLLAGSLFGQEKSAAAQNSAAGKGTFYVDGIVYQYAIGTNFVVVAAAHSVINRKFLAVKVRVYNASPHSITVKPEDVVVEDAVADHALISVSAAELAKRMRRPQNMARFAVSPGGSADSEAFTTSDMSNPQLQDMMRAMAARNNAYVNPTTVAGRNVLYTDTPGAFDASDAAPVAAECDQVCRLRNREANGHDALAQLQRQNSPDYVEQCGFLANTVAPHDNVGGILYFPLGKMTEGPAEASKGNKSRVARVTVPIAGESFQFVLPVE